MLWSYVQNRHCNTTKGQGKSSCSWMRKVAGNSSGSKHRWMTAVQKQQQQPDGAGKGECMQRDAATPAAAAAALLLPRAAPPAAQ